MDIDKLAVIAFFAFFLFMWLFKPEFLENRNERMRNEMEKNTRFLKPVGKAGFSLLAWLFKRRG